MHLLLVRAAICDSTPSDASLLFHHNCSSQPDRYQHLSSKKEQIEQHLDRRKKTNLHAGRGRGWIRAVRALPTTPPNLMHQSPDRPPTVKQGGLCQGAQENKQKKPSHREGREKREKSGLTDSRAG